MASLSNISDEATRQVIQNLSERLDRNIFSQGRWQKVSVNITEDLFDASNESLKVTGLVVESEKRRKVVNFPHGLGFTPRTVLVSSISGNRNFDFLYTRFDDFNLVLECEGPVLVDCLIGDTGEPIVSDVRRSSLPSHTDYGILKPLELVSGRVSDNNFRFVNSFSGEFRRLFGVPELGKTYLVEYRSRFPTDSDPLVNRSRSDPSSNAETVNWYDTSSCGGIHFGSSFYRVHTGNLIVQKRKRPKYISEDDPCVTETVNDDLKVALDSLCWIRPFFLLQYNANKNFIDLYADNAYQALVTGSVARNYYPDRHPPLNLSFSVKGELQVTPERNVSNDDWRDKFSDDFVYYIGLTLEGLFLDFSPSIDLE